MMVILLVLWLFLNVEPVDVAEGCGLSKFLDKPHPAAFCFVLLWHLFCAGVEVFYCVG